MLTVLVQTVKVLRSGPVRARAVAAGKQDETFVPLRGTLTMYLGEPPERHEVPVGGLVHVEAGTVLQIVNETDEEVVVCVCGAPPERAGAEMFESAV
jgi:quercetin dioxygenase-like cupin family protein